MGSWTVRADDSDDVDSTLIDVKVDGRAITLHMPSPDPVAVTATKVEEIRLALAIAIGEAEQR